MSKFNIKIDDFESSDILDGNIKSITITTDKEVKVYNIESEIDSKTTSRRKVGIKNEVRR